MTAPFVQWERPDAPGTGNGRSADVLAVDPVTRSRGADRPEVFAIARPGVVLLQLLVAGTGWWSVVATLGGEPTLLRSLLLIGCLVVASGATVAVIGSFAVIASPASRTSTVIGATGGPTPPHTGQPARD